MIRGACGPLAPAPWLCTALLVTAVLSGCALTGKSDPLTPRYFSPEVASTGAPAPSPKPAGAVELRVGRVTASAHLADRIVYRSAEHELGFYEERRWTERPEAYLRRALGRALFERGGVVRVVSGAAPTLDIELTGFEEIRATPPVARARATMLLYDGRAVLREQTITVERPIRVAADGSVGAEAAVQSLTDAMAELVTQVTNNVVAALPVARPATGNAAAAAPAAPAVPATATNAAAAARPSPASAAALPVAPSAR